MEGVSFVVPVHNGVSCVRDTISSIQSQRDGRPMEVIVVDDGSSDGTGQLLRTLAERWPLRVIAGEGRGAAAAINAGVRAARFPIICQVDQDVVLQPGWMPRLTSVLEDPKVAAVQGYYESDPGATLCVRAMGLDLEQRYAAVVGPETDHVCTGNAAYRAAALEQVGLFDESLGYGYDNDVSYRLRAAGFVLAFCRDARSRHRWREGLAGYIVQQYGFGYGRLDLVAKHPTRLRGDRVSPLAMMLHPLIMTLALAGVVGAGITALAGGHWVVPAAWATILIAGLALERLAAGASAARRFRTLVPFVFPFLHLGRDLAWTAAIVSWSVRRLGGRPSIPSHSMHPRAGRAS